MISNQPARNDILRSTWLRYVKRPARGRCDPVEHEPSQPRPAWISAFRGGLSCSVVLAGVGRAKRQRARLRRRNAGGHRRRTTNPLRNLTWLFRSSVACR